MGVRLARTSHEISKQIADEIGENISKVQLVIQTFQKRIRIYLESGETVPIYSIATIKVTKSVVKYSKNGNDKYREEYGDLNITTKQLVQDVANILKFTYKDTDLILDAYREHLITTLEKGKSVRIGQLICINIYNSTEQGYTVMSRVSHTLRKELNQYTNIQVRTSEYLKRRVNQQLSLAQLGVV